MRAPVVALTGPAAQGITTTGGGSWTVKLGDQSKAQQATAKSAASPAKDASDLNLQELVAALKEIFSKDEVEAQEIQEAMARYRHDLGEWEKYLFFDEAKYTRNLVGGDSRFNVIVMGWSEGQRTPIHDHAGSHCIMKIVSGEVVETQFMWPSEEDVASSRPLTVKKKSTHSVGDIAYIHDKIGLHRIGNPSPSVKAVSVHVYSPPICECELFDESTSKHASLANVTFYSVEGQKLASECPVRIVSGIGDAQDSGPSSPASR